MSPEGIARYRSRWRLQPEGEPLETPTSWLQAVACPLGPAMLKILKPESDEGNAPALLRYWDGEGAVRLYQAEDAAFLMERAEGPRSLPDMALSGQDLEAAAILADAVERLHGTRTLPLPRELTPLATQFASLFERRADHPLLQRCAGVAEVLFEQPQDVRPLHGDLHHWNLLDGGARGWLAIDPKALLGERTYDVANLLRNPWPHSEVVHDSARMLRLASFYSERLAMDKKRVLRFAFAHCGLSAAWDMEDGDDPAFSLTCAEILAPLTV